MLGSPGNCSRGSGAVGGLRGNGVLGGSHPAPPGCSRPPQPPGSSSQCLPVLQFWSYWFSRFLFYFFLLSAAAVHQEKVSKGKFARFRWGEPRGGPRMPSPPSSPPPPVPAAGSEQPQDGDALGRLRGDNLGSIETGLCAPPKAPPFVPWGRIRPSATDPAGLGGLRGPGGGTKWVTPGPSRALLWLGRGGKRGSAIPDPPQGKGNEPGPLRSPPSPPLPVQPVQAPRN